MTDSAFYGTTMHAVCCLNPIQRCLRNLPFLSSAISPRPLVMSMRWRCGTLMYGWVDLIHWSSQRILQCFPRRLLVQSSSYLCYRDPNGSFSRRNEDPGIQYPPFFCVLLSFSAMHTHWSSMIEHMYRLGQDMIRRSWNLDVQCVGASVLNNGRYIIPSENYIKGSCVDKYTLHSHYRSWHHSATQRFWRRPVYIWLPEQRPRSLYGRTRSSWN